MTGLIPQDRTVKTQCSSGVTHINSTKQLNAIHIFFRYTRVAEGEVLGRSLNMNNKCG